MIVSFTIHVGGNFTIFSNITKSSKAQITIFDKGHIFFNFSLDSMPPFIMNSMGDTCNVHKSESPIIEGVKYKRMYSVGGHKVCS